MLRFTLKYYLSIFLHFQRGWMCCAGKNLTQEERYLVFFWKFTFSLDGLNLVVDWLFIIFNILIPIVWFYSYGWTFPFQFFHRNELNNYCGRSVAGSIFVGITSSTAFAQVGRIWINLGPTYKVYGKYLVLAFLAAFSPPGGIAIDRSWRSRHIHGDMEVLPYRLAQANSS